MWKYLLKKINFRIFNNKMNEKNDEKLSKLKVSQIDGTMLKRK